MGRRIGKLPRPVSGRRDNTPRRVEDHRPHGHFAAQGGGAGFG